MKTLLESLVASGLLAQDTSDTILEEFEHLMAEETVDVADTIMEDEPDLFLANVIADTTDMATAARRRIYRAKAGEARLKGVLATQQRKRQDAKNWFNVSYELRTMRS